MLFGKRSFGKRSFGGRRKGSRNVGPSKPRRRMFKRLVEIVKGMRSGRKSSGRRRGSVIPSGTMKMKNGKMVVRVGKAWKVTHKDLAGTYYNSGVSKAKVYVNTMGKVRGHAGRPRGSRNSRRSAGRRRSHKSSKMRGVKGRPRGSKNRHHRRSMPKMRGVKGRPRGSRNLRASKPRRRSHKRSFGRRFRWGSGRALNLADMAGPY